MSPQFDFCATRQKHGHRLAASLAFARILKRLHVVQPAIDNIRHDYADTFSPYAIDDVTLEIAIEGWAIWRRWAVARRAGTTPATTHPALPEEQERYHQLEREFRIRVADLVALPRHPRAEFRGVHDEFSEVAMAATLEVRWT